MLISIRDSLSDKTECEVRDFCSVYNVVRSDYLYRVVLSGNDADELRDDISNQIENISAVSNKKELPQDSCIFNIDYDLESYRNFAKENKVYNNYVKSIAENIVCQTDEKERVIMGVALYKFISEMGLKKYFVQGNNYTKLLLMISSKQINEYDAIIDKYLVKKDSLDRELEGIDFVNYENVESYKTNSVDIQNALLEKAVIQYECGTNIEWNHFYTYRKSFMPKLPGYEFDEQYYWSDYHRHAVDDLANEHFLDDFLSSFTEEETENEHIFSINLRSTAMFIDQHRIYQKEVLVGTFQVMLINKIAGQLYSRDFMIHELFYLQKIDPVKNQCLRVVIQKDGDIKEGKIMQKDDNGEWITKTVFNISLNKGSGSYKDSSNEEIVGEFVKPDYFYKKLSSSGLNLGSDYQIMNTIIKSNQRAIALLDETDLFPAILDSASQLMYLYRNSDNDLYMPYFFSSFEQWGSLEKVNRVEGNIISETEEELIAELDYYDDNHLVARFGDYHLKHVKNIEINSLDEIIGERAKLPDGTDLYQHTIRVTGTSLHDHVVYNRLTIPGAYFITQMMQFAEKELQIEQFELENINFYNAMVLEENELIKELIQIRQNANEYEIGICSHLNSNDVFIDNVKMTLSAGAHINTLVVEDSIDKENANGKYISGEDIIKIQWKIGLNLSDTFHWMEEVWIYENAILGKLSNSSFDLLQGNYGTPPGLIDTAVQILGLYKNVNQQDEGAYIPLTINKIIQYQKIANKLNCMVYNIREAGELLSADIIYYNPEDSKKVLEFKEITLIKADRKKLGSVKVNNSLISEQEWAEKQIDKLTDLKYSNALEIRLGIINKKVIITKYQTNDSKWNIVSKILFDLEDDSWENAILEELKDKQQIVVLSDSSECISLVDKKAEDINRISKLITNYYFGVLKLIQKINISDDVLCFVTNQVYTTEVAKMNIIASIVWGLVRSLQLELADQNVIVYDSDISSVNRIERINQLIMSKILQAKEYDGIVKIPKITKSIVENESESPITISEDKSYAVIGGFGALGLETCKRMVNEGARRLIVIGRSDLAHNKEKMDQLYSMSKDLSIEYHQLDISRSSEKSRLISILSKEKNVGGIVYAVGVVKDKIYSNYTDEDIQAVYESKINGVVTLFEALEDIDFDFCACYSSIVSTMGAAGQSVYGAANSFIDSLCNYMRQKGKNIFSIQWGPWDEIGMFSKLDDISVKRYELRNIFAMKAEEAMDAFILSLNRSKNQMILRQKRVKENTRIDIENNIKPFSKTIRKEEYSILEQLKKIVAESIGLNEVYKLKTDVSLMELGVDSLLMIEIRMKINKLFEVNISLDKFFEQMTIDKLNDIITNK